MAKVIRPTYPLEFSIGLLLLIFVLSTFLAGEIFAVSWNEILSGGKPVFGMVLVGISVVIVALILWEEFLFPVRIKPENDEIVFRNHYTKLKTQILIYCAIPVIIVVVYFNYEVSHFPFFIWAIVCTVSPVVGRLLSGIKNYNDFLKLKGDAIEYKNNEKEGVLSMSEVKEIMLIKDEARVLHKVQFLMKDGAQVIIDLDEMELEAYYKTIEGFIRGHFGNLIRSNP